MSGAKDTLSNCAWYALTYVLFVNVKIIEKSTPIGRGHRNILKEIRKKETKPMIFMTIFVRSEEINGFIPIPLHMLKITPYIKYPSLYPSVSRAG
ncbi:hypothetical protein GCM10007870_22580 [Gluconobacter kondonii]|uniref:Uncharacterized protein n=1 Tax=Gluconobacter kondonii TaxID=941463 RepID=A0ABQ5WU97_9PROT|nr:hypothetical protein GCM10007870_22580 [Gluconobacter kondonii]